MMNELTKQLSNFPQQINEIHEVPLQKHITFYELYNGDHLTGFFLLMKK